jgi:hypothetical protein
MVDIDLGEMFLNFPLPFVLEQYSGINVTTFTTEIDNDKGVECFLDDLKTKAWANWDRCLMGLKPSPYMAVRFYYFAEEFARSNRRAKSNPL